MGFSLIIRWEYEQQSVKCSHFHLREEDAAEEESDNVELWILRQTRVLIFTHSCQIYFEMSLQWEDQDQV